jgi:hypothetical protein
MKYLLFLILLTFSFVPAMADDCIFDQANQVKVLADLQAKYPNSKLYKDKRLLIIVRGPKVIEYQRGGCDHFGVKLTLITDKKNDFATQNDIFNQVIILTKEFWKDHVTGSEVENLLAENLYSYEASTNREIFILQHKHAVNDFVIIHEWTNRNHQISISYYIN